MNNFKVGDTVKIISSISIGPKKYVGKVGVIIMIKNDNRFGYNIDVDVGSIYVEHIVPCHEREIRLHKSIKQKLKEIEEL